MKRPTRRHAAPASTSSSEAALASAAPSGPAAEPSLCVTAVGGDADTVAHAAALAAELGVELLANAPASTLCLQVSAGGCRLAVPGFAEPLGLAVDDLEVRRRAASGKRLELLRACGWPLAGKHVLDATAGFGRDAFVLAMAGAAVDMIEREPLLHVLLRDAIARAGTSTLRVFHGDALRRMPALFDGHDVIYLDPMFERGGSALPQREGQVLALLAEHERGEALLDVALSLRPKRVVVKRARSQTPLAGSVAPHHRIVGRRVRFDVYMPMAPGG